MENRRDIDNTENSNIDISESNQVQYWSEKFNVPEEVLKNAVRTAGTSAEDVREHLEENN